MWAVGQGQSLEWLPFEIMMLILVLPSAIGLLRFLGVE